jgi:ABC-2 type transport system ATP-binding protein
VRDVTAFGASLHARVEAGAPSPSDAAAALGAAGASEVVVEAAEPSLEDVFLAVAGRGAGAARAGEGA